VPQSTEEKESGHLAPRQLRLPHLLRFSKGGHPEPGRFKNFHRPTVTSNLVCRFQIGDHGRGRDGRHKPTRRAPKSFVSRILVPKLFDIRILRGISC
jgi:hypothetical protein